MSDPVPAADPLWGALLAAAHEARANAYAPYSGFAVGAALACADGTIVAGCNVENASYGATICAERNAILHAVATGRRQFTRCLVVTPGAEPFPPCGLCRQVLAEFARDLPIVLVAADSGARRATTLAAIFADPFIPPESIKAGR